MKKASIFCNEIALSLTIKISFNYTSGYLRAKIFKIFKLYIYIYTNIRENEPTSENTLTR